MYIYFFMFYRMASQWNQGWGNSTYPYQNQPHNVYQYHQQPSVYYNIPRQYQQVHGHHPPNGYINQSQPLSITIPPQQQVSHGHQSPSLYQALDSINLSEFDGRPVHLSPTDLVNDYASLPLLIDSLDISQFKRTPLLLSPSDLVGTQVAAMNPIIMNGKGVGQSPKYKRKRSKSPTMRRKVRIEQDKTEAAKPYRFEKIQTEPMDLSTRPRGRQLKRDSPVTRRSHRSPSPVRGKQPRMRQLRLNEQAQILPPNQGVPDAANVNPWRPWESSTSKSDNKPFHVRQLNHQVARRYGVEEMKYQYRLKDDNHGKKLKDITDDIEAMVQVR